MDVDSTSGPPRQTRWPTGDIFDARNFGRDGLFKNVFEWRVKMPVKGLQRSQLLALGAVVVYQLVLLYQHEHDLPLGKGIKP
jgi:hypothetical protein